MLDHVTIGAMDLELAITFNDQALVPLGIRRLYGEGTDFAGYGVTGKLCFWIGRRASVTTGPHIAFVAAARAIVDAFQAAALMAGGRDNGAPGPRPQ